VTRTTALSKDAALVLGIASTALAFARSREAEAERWLRILRLHGEAGTALCALGVTEAPLEPAGAHASGEVATSAEGGETDPVTRVTDRAQEISAERGASSIGSVEVLLAVMDVYGGAFDHVLEAHGTDRAEVSARLGAQSP